MLTINEMLAYKEAKEQMMILEILTGVTLLATSFVAEQYVKRYHADVWEELNKWGD